MAHRTPPSDSSCTFCLFRRTWWGSGLQRVGGRSNEPTKIRRAEKERSDTRAANIHAKFTIWWNKDRQQRPRYVHDEYFDCLTQPLIINVTINRRFLPGKIIRVDNRSLIKSLIQCTGISTILTPGIYNDFNSYEIAKNPRPTLVNNTSIWQIIIALWDWLFVNLCFLDFTQKLLMQTVR